VAAHVFAPFAQDILVKAGLRIRSTLEHRLVADRDNPNSLDIKGDSSLPKLYFGNLASSVTSDDLVEHFSRAGEVTGALAISDKVSDLCRVFGFVGNGATSGACVAFSLLNNTLLDGQPIRIEPDPSLKMAKPETERRNLSVHRTFGTFDPVEVRN
jgi:RNA recognition motif-containing protein